jgi:hypothetical protein
MLAAMSVTRALSSLMLLAVSGVAGSAPTGVEHSAVAPSLFLLAGIVLATLLLRPLIHRILLIAERHVGLLRVHRLVDRLGPDVLHDFIVPAANGGLAKIDHAMRSGDGIVCVQVRHRSGLIFGNEQDPQWSIVDGVERRGFLNPLVHADGCRRAIEKIVPGVPVRCVVVFTGRPEFASARPDGILRTPELENYLARIEFPPSDVDDWNAVWLTVRSAARTDEATRRDYAAQLGFV